MNMDRNPQAEQMAHESMVRNLAAQAKAIWPEESRLFDRYTLPAEPRILDVGCGSGEISRRLLLRYPTATLVGVDILEGPLHHARTQCAEFGSRARFEQGDAFSLACDSSAFDLVVCRHMTQAIPEPERMLEELTRVCRSGGWLHVLSEDYQMLHFPEGALDPDRLWREGVGVLARGTHTDERVGRKTWSMMKKIGLVELHVDYAVVDTIRTPRETFAEIIRAWRDGYADAIAEHSALDHTTVVALFDQAISSIVDPSAYAVWHVPIVSGRRP